MNAIDRPASTEDGAERFGSDRGLAASAPSTAQSTVAQTPRSQQIEGVAAGLRETDLIEPDEQRPRERFIPITRFALIDRLTRTKAWKGNQANEARRFFRYLDYWRHQSYNARLLELEQTYEPFSPDSDLLMTREYQPSELKRMQARFISEMREILIQANYEEIPPDKADAILSAESHYGLDLHVDFSLFEEVAIFYRGASQKKNARRRLQKFFLKEEFDLPIFQRLFLLFKIKPLETSIRDFIEKEKVSRKEAERMAKKQRAYLPAAVTDDNIYMKLFKNIPRSDIEMVFPNTEVRYRMFDKLMLGGGGIAGLGGPVVGAITKFGALANPFVAVPVAIGIGGALFRGAMNFVNKRNKYMVVMAQNLYFHSMADNRGVMIKLADRAAEEDVKEEILLYAVLAKTPAKRSELHDIDRGIEKWLHSTFGVDVDFDLHDALSRLLADGIVTEEPDGSLRTLQPHEAALHLDAKWDVFLDHLPDVECYEEEGTERETADTEAARTALGLSRPRQEKVVSPAAAIIR